MEVAGTQRRTESRKRGRPSLWEGGGEGGQVVPLFQSVALYQEGEGVEGEVEKGEVVEGSQEEVLHLVMDR